MKLKKLLPMSPYQGPPFPKFLNWRWHYSPDWLKPEQEIELVKKYGKGAVHFAEFVVPEDMGVEVLEKVAEDWRDRMLRAFKAEYRVKEGE